MVEYYYGDFGPAVRGRGYGYEDLKLEDQIQDNCNYFGQDVIDKNKYSANMDSLMQIWS